MNVGDGRCAWSPLLLSATGRRITLHYEDVRETPCAVRDLQVIVAGELGYDSNSQWVAGSPPEVIT